MHPVARLQTLLLLRCAHSTRFRSIMGASNLTQLRYSIGPLDLPLLVGVGPLQLCPTFTLGGFSRRPPTLPPHRTSPTPRRTCSFSALSASNNTAGQGGDHIFSAERRGPLPRAVALVTSRRGSSEVFTRHDTRHTQHVLGADHPTARETFKGS